MPWVMLMENKAEIKKPAKLAWITPSKILRLRSSGLSLTSGLMAALDLKDILSAEISRGAGI
jgi:hypothetical protein